MNGAVASGVEGERPLAVVVLAAGHGTRMKSARAKVLHRLGGRPLIAHVLAAVGRLAPARVVVVVGHQADDVRAASVGAANGHGDDIRFVHQAVRRGTGDAVRCAVPVLGDFRGDVLILYGDTPTVRAETLARLVDGHRRSGAALSLLTARFSDPTGYGRIVRDAGGALEAIVEERDANADQRRIDEVNPGVYCVATEFLWRALGGLGTDNAQGEYYLTDIVRAARAAGRRIWSSMVEDPNEVSGINTRADLAEKETQLRRDTVTRWMAAGVTFEDPASAYVGPEVTIGPDTTIGPNTHLRGRTVVGEGCRIDGSVYLEDARLGDRVRLKFGVVITDSTVGDDAEIGPFAHLRPGTRLAERVKIGNFVEAKKAVIGRRSKANHLSYLGDVVVGEETNVGAGTITCNYDGFHKHQTVIGDRVQIGSDTQLVAPVEIGSDAYVAAGTTVTAAVPPGALVLSRVPQKLVPGWTERRRASERGETPVSGATSPQGSGGPRPRPRRRRGGRGGRRRTAAAKSVESRSHDRGPRKSRRQRPRPPGRGRRR
jgi:bifunctional UDP-N-acetylglucosamine pyrophosphorylase/glucosamine-1-phosphate N-acetyltransferase